MNSMKGKVIVILGASSGIGEATVKLLARKGAKLVIASRREEKLKTLAYAIETPDRMSVSEMIIRPTKQAI